MWKCVTAFAVGGLSRKGWLRLQQDNRRVDMERFLSRLRSTDDWQELAALLPSESSCAHASRILTDLSGETARNSPVHQSWFRK